MWYSIPTNITTTTTTNTTWNWETQRTWTTSTASSSNWNRHKRDIEFLQDWIKSQEKKEKFVEYEIKEKEILDLIKGDD